MANYTRIYFLIDDPFIKNNPLQYHEHTIDWISTLELPQLWKFNNLWTIDCNWVRFSKRNWKIIGETLSESDLQIFQKFGLENHIVYKDWSKEWFYTKNPFIHKGKIGFVKVLVYELPHSNNHIWNDDFCITAQTGWITNPTQFEAFKKSVNSETLEIILEKIPEWSDKILINRWT
jgi:hypothetical protein